MADRPKLLTCNVCDKRTDVVFQIAFDHAGVAMMESHLRDDHGLKVPDPTVPRPPGARKGSN